MFLHYPKVPDLYAQPYHPWENGSLENANRLIRRFTPKSCDIAEYSRALPNKAAWGSKNFAFKDILKCGFCGASITAEEKFKQRVDGGFNRHVYYHCTGKVDPNCPEKKSINEVDLIAQLTEFIAENHDQIEVSDELAQRMLSHAEIVEYSIQSRGATDEEIDPLSEYSRYILAKGSYSDQGQLVAGIKGVFSLQGKVILLRR